MNTTTAQPTIAAAAATETIGRYSTYAAAEHHVDALSDAGFPVQHLSIVGDDLYSLERVTDRLTTVGATAVGAAQGAWMGLVLTAIFLLLTPWSDWTAIWIIPLAAAGGAISAGFAHAATRGRRDFASTQQIRAGAYVVVVNASHAQQARDILRQTQP